MQEPSSDTLLAGRLVLRQSPGGHRAGTDAVLLAAAAPLDSVDKVVDLGASTGAVGLLAALRAPAARIVLVEIDPAAAAMARENATANGLSGRVDVVVADVRAPRRDRAALGLAGGDAGLVLANPPYLVEGRARLSPDAARRIAHAMAPGDLDLWVKAALDLLQPKGRIVLIHRADALGEVLSVLERRFGGISVRAVHPRENEPASRILITGRRGSRAPLAILPPLVLHGPDGRFTPLAEALHRGEAALA